MDYIRLMELNKGNDLLVQNNKYGYRLNLKHPTVLQLYKKYREWLKIPAGFPLSDSERFDFEDKAIAKLIKHELLII